MVIVIQKQDYILIIVI